MSAENMKEKQQAEAAYTGFIQNLVTHKVGNVADLIQQILLKKQIMTPQEKLAKIDLLKLWLDSFRPLASDVVAELKKHYDVKFTYNSNAIEGNTLTQSETEMVLEKGITVGGKTLAEHLEVVGHKEAIDYIEFLAQKDSPITEREIKDIHHLLMKGVDRSDAGSYRTLDVRAAGTDHLYPPHYLVKEMMEHFIVWLNSDEAKNLHSLNYAAEVHYRFVSIHPFKDGNGRTARLLMNLALLRKGYPVVVIPNSVRSDYIESLVFDQDNQDNTLKLFELVLDCCEESLIDYLRVASTAVSSKGKGSEFYKNIKDFLGE